MKLKTVAGFSMGAVGVFLIYMTVCSLSETIGNGESLWIAIVTPPSALRILAAMAAFISCLATLVEKQGGAWLTGISSFIFGILTFCLLANRAQEIEAWRNEAVILIALTGLSLSLVVAQNEARKKREAYAENAQALR